MMSWLCHSLTYLTSLFGHFWFIIGIYGINILHAIKLWVNGKQGDIFSQNIYQWNYYLVCDKSLSLGETRRYFFLKRWIHGNFTLKEALDETSRNLADRRTREGPKFHVCSDVTGAKGWFQGTYCSLFLCSPRIGEFLSGYQIYIFICQRCYELWSLRMQLHHGMRCT